MNEHSNSGVNGVYFDRDALRERLLHDEALIRLVLETFVKDIPCQLTVLRSALAAADAVLARRQAHTIKGAAANVGAEPLSRVAQAMERLCEEGKLQDVAALLPEWESLWSATLAAMGTLPSAAAEGGA